MTRRLWRNAMFAGIHGTMSSHTRDFIRAVRGMVNVQRDPSLNPENQTTKAQRHEEVRSQLSVFFVSL